MGLFRKDTKSKTKEEPKPKKEAKPKKETKPEKEAKPKKETKTDSSDELKALKAEVKTLKAELEKTKKALEEALKKNEQNKPAPPKPKIIKDGHEYVDLGLPSGLKWATCNIGADKPEQYGDYYAWGETKTKKEYTEGNSNTYGKDRNDISGSTRYDAARANWGGSWRLPTKEEFEELIKCCKFTWTTLNGIKGHSVKGLNGNSIFLPAAGCRDGSSLYYEGYRGYYWSSTPYVNDYGHNAYGLNFDSGGEYVDTNGRNDGHTVRPVSE